MLTFIPYSVKSFTALKNILIIEYVPPGCFYPYACPNCSDDHCISICNHVGLQYKSCLNGWVYDALPYCVQWLMKRLNTRRRLIAAAERTILLSWIVLLYHTIRLFMNSGSTNLWFNFSKMNKTINTKLRVIIRPTRWRSSSCFEVIFMNLLTT